MKIAVLTSPSQWFIPYAKKLVDEIKDATLFYNHKEMNDQYDITFILSYHNIISKEYLTSKHNIVIHASKLPEGKGWAPMFWQILDDKNIIPFSMFEASTGVDNGDIYMLDELRLTGLELNDELRKKQATFIIKMCKKFINNYKEYSNPKSQTGIESFYKKRSTKDSELDISKSIDSQFNLLRIVDNENYPAFFYKNGKKYILKIEEGNYEDR